MRGYEHRKHLNIVYDYDFWPVGTIASMNSLSVIIIAHIAYMNKSTLKRLMLSIFKSIVWLNLFNYYE